MAVLFQGLLTFSVLWNISMEARCHCRMLPRNQVEAGCKQTQKSCRGRKKEIHLFTLVREAMSFVLAMRAAMVQACMWPREELTLGSWKYVVEEGSSVASSLSCMYSSKFQERNTCSILLLRVS